MSGACCGPTGNDVVVRWRRTCESAAHIRRYTQLSDSVRRGFGGPDVSCGVGIDDPLLTGRPRCFRGDCQPCRRSNGGQVLLFGEDAQGFVLLSGDVRKHSRVCPRWDEMATSRVHNHLMPGSAHLSKTGSPDRVAIASHRDGTEPILVSSAFRSRDTALLAYRQRNTRGVEPQGIKEAVSG